MVSATVRIRPRSLEMLKELATEGRESVQDVLDRAIEQYRRQKFLERINADYAALRADPEAWREEREEREAWDSTLMDGLDPDENWEDAEAEA